MVSSLLQVLENGTQFASLAVRTCTHQTISSALNTWILILAMNPPHPRFFLHEAEKILWEEWVLIIGRYSRQSLGCHPSVDLGTEDVTLELFCFQPRRELKGHRSPCSRNTHSCWWLWRRGVIQKGICSFSSFENFLWCSKNWKCKAWMLEDLIIPDAIMKVIFGRGREDSWLKHFQEWSSSSTGSAEGHPILCSLWCFEEAG